MRIAAVGLVLFALLTPLGSALPTESVVLVNRTFECSQYPQPINYDLVKVTVSQNPPRRADGFHTGQNCRGRIGRVELLTPTDGMKIQNGARDLTIEGGFINCYPPTGDHHQDGVQITGGQRITLRNVSINCGSNSAIWFKDSTDVVCDGCTLRKQSQVNRTVKIGPSLRSGVRNSTIYWCGSSCNNQVAVQIGSATQPVNQNNMLRLYGG
jgi:hypothetical protein